MAGKSKVQDGEENEDAISKCLWTQYEKVPMIGMMAIVANYENFHNHPTMNKWMNAPAGHIMSECNLGDEWIRAEIEPKL